MLPNRFLRIALQRLRAVIRRDTLDAELDRELAFHLEQLTAEYVASGLRPADARRAAQRDLGNLPLVAEQCRDTRRVSWLHDFRQDVAYGLRAVVRHPTVSCVIVASLALGIGANTAVLGAIDAVLHAHLPVPDAERVLVVRTYRQDGSAPRSPVTIADYFAWSAQQQSFESIALTLGNQSDFPGAHGWPAERIVGVAATAALFPVLRVTPSLGRLYTDDEARRVQPSIPLVLSHRLWQRRFGGAPDVLGTRLRLGRRDAYVVGVMPEGFHYPNQTVEYWIPIVANAGAPQSPQRLFGVTARLAPGVAAGQAEADLNRIAARLAAERPDRHGGWQVSVEPLREAMYGWTSQPLWTLQGAVALVLLVACTNVAGLLLARAVARRPEIAVRAALGASRGRLVRQLIAETTILTSAGAVVGLVLAWAGLRALSALPAPPGALGMVDVTLNGRIVGIAALIAVAATFLFGLVPALAGSRFDISEFRTRRWREGLVAAQIAVTCVLLSGTGLLTRSFIAVITRDVYFEPDGLLTFQFTLPLDDFMRPRGAVDGRPYFDIAPSAAQTIERLHDTLRAMPGAVAVAGSSTPFVNSLVVPSADVQAWPPADAGAAGAGTFDAAYFMVTPGFFTTIGTPMVHGRDIGPGDRADATWVAVVNEAAARRLWPGVDPIGRYLVLRGVPDEQPRRVVGVVPDIPVTLPQPAPRPALYMPYLQQPDRHPLPGANLRGQMVFAVRAAGDPLALLPPVRELVAASDPERPIANVATMAEQVRARVPRRGDLITILAAFTASAVLLAAVGIYGIVSYTAACRTREIGVRIALGARARHVAGLVARRALLLVAGGLVAGLAGAVVLTRLLRSQLWEISPTDPLTYAAGLTLLSAVGALACALPTRRAAAVNPTIALRCE